MVASDDDQSPSLQLWDLRNSVSPIREFHGHAKVGCADAPGPGASWRSHCATSILQFVQQAEEQREACQRYHLYLWLRYFASVCVFVLQGVLGMSWCPQDSSFLLSSGKDNRTLCWDVNAGG